MLVPAEGLFLGVFGQKLREYIGVLYGLTGSLTHVRSSGVSGIPQ